MILAFCRTIKYAFQDFFRNTWLSVVTISVLVLMLLTVNLLIVFQFLTTGVVQLVEDKLDISLYFVPEVAEEDVLALKADLLSLPEVESVQFVSREERVQAFQREYEKVPSVTESLNEVEENPFGPLLVVHGRDPSEYPAILEFIDASRYVQFIEERDYENHQLVIERIGKITATAKRAVQGLSAVFTVIALLVVFNTIRMTIYTHREEIGIMKTVGAANWFVRFPYILQGVLYSIFALIVTLLLWYGLLYLAEPYVQNFFSGELSLVSYFQAHLFTIFGIEFLAMAGLNMLTSSFAIQRYLRG